MHPRAFGGRALPQPAGEFTSLLWPPTWIKDGIKGKKGGGRKSSGKEGKRKLRGKGDGRRGTSCNLRTVLSYLTRLKTLLSPPKEGDYVFALVCLSVCAQDYSKSYEAIMSTYAVHQNLLKFVIISLSYRRRRSGHFYMSS